MTKSQKENRGIQCWRERYLAHPIHPYKLLGLKISTIGLIIGVVGALIGAYLIPTLGKTAFLLGVFIVLSGFAFTVAFLLTPENQLPSKRKKEEN